MSLKRRCLSYHSLRQSDDLRILQDGHVPLSHSPLSLLRTHTLAQHCPSVACEFVRRPFPAGCCLAALRLTLRLIPSLQLMFPPCRLLLYCFFVVRSLLLSPLEPPSLLSAFFCSVFTSSALCPCHCCCLDSVFCSGTGQPSAPPASWNHQLSLESPLRLDRTISSSPSYKYTHTWNHDSQNCWKYDGREDPPPVSEVEPTYTGHELWSGHGLTCHRFTFHLIMIPPPRCFQMNPKKEKKIEVDPTGLVNQGWGPEMTLMTCCKFFSQ
jgi:hypothetical protein